MNIMQLLYLVFRALNIGVWTPLERFARGTLRVLQIGVVPSYIFGLFGPWFFQASWPAWYGALVCGLVWFVVEGRILLPLAVLELFAGKQIQITREMEFAVPNVRPGRVAHIISTVGMWALAPLIILGIFPLWKPVPVPGVGMVDFYWPFLVIVMGTLYVVATSEEISKFWRIAYGWGLAIIAIPMVSLYLLCWFMPNTAQYFANKLNRNDGNTVVLDKSEQLVNDVCTKHETALNQEIAVLIDSKWSATRAGTTWTQANEDRLLMLQNLRSEVRAKCSATETSPATVKKVSFEMPEVNPLYVIPFALLTAIIVWPKSKSHGH